MHDLKNIWLTVCNSFYYHLYFAQSFNQTRLLLLPCHVRMINHSSITLQNGLQTPCFSLPCWVNKKLLLCNLGHHLQTIFCLPHPTTYTLVQTREQLRGAQKPICFCQSISVSWIWKVLDSNPVWDTKFCLSSFFVLNFRSCLI